MSTSIALVTCAAVSSERRMCSAIPRRIAVIGSSVSPGSSAVRAPARVAWRGARPAEPVAAAGGGGRRAGGGVQPAGPQRASGSARPAASAAADSTKARMSFFVTRPSRPVPVTVAGSMPCSAAIRATTGETKACARAVGRRSPAGARRLGAPVRARLGSAAGSAVGLRLGSGSSRLAARRRRAARRGAAAGAAARRRSGADPREQRPDGDRLALLDEDLLEHARAGARNLGVDLVGRDLEQRLVGRDRVADVLAATW